MKKTSLAVMVILPLLVVAALSGAVAAATSVTVVSPNTSIPGETLKVNIRGTDLTGATAITFGPEISVDSFTVDSDTKITAFISIDGDATVGARDVSVITPYGTATRTDAFTVVSGAAPRLVSLSDTRGIQEETLTVVITGTDLSGATGVSFGSGITVDSYTVDSGTRITAFIIIDGDANVGTRDVSVTTPYGTDVMTDAFTVISWAAPRLTSLNPTEGVRGETLTVVITGTGLAGATAISFGPDVTVRDFNVDSSTRVTAEIVVDADATYGARDVSVTTAYGTGWMTDGFTVSRHSSNGTSHGGGGIPFWVWIIVGASGAVAFIGLGAYMMGRKRPAKPQQ